MHISKMIRSKRQEREITQIELSRRVGCHNQVLSDVEKRKRNLPKKYVSGISRELEIPEQHLEQAIAAYPDAAEIGCLAAS